MTDAAHPDQSMEEILQSIKRIIAEEGEPAAPATGSDILELTDFLDEEFPAAPAPAPETNTVTDFSGMSLDEIMAAPIPPLEGAALADAMEFSPPPMEPLPEPEPVLPEPVVVAPPPPPPPAPPARAEHITTFEENLISEATREASKAALEALQHRASSGRTSMATSFRSGNTVEDLVVETLRPLLKDWLDQHLVGIVERLVAREIQRMTDR